jgi:hypothetical protein
MNSTEAELSCDTGLKQILDLFPLLRLSSCVVKVATLCSHCVQEQTAAFRAHLENQIYSL